MAEPVSSAPDVEFSSVVNPRIPRSYSLCGDKVDLDRVDMYERFDRELTSMAYTHGTTLLMLKRANKYFPVIAPILKANGMPDDIIYLACVESSLNPRALSPAKAGGMWQFMPSTGRQYGLEVGDEVDERYNIEKATAAACRYLKKYKAQYGDWVSAMAAYNAGPTRISGELDSQMGDTAFDLYLNEETSRYVFRIMATKAIFENPKAFGFDLSEDQLYMPVECDVVEVSGPVPSWPQWAADHGITYAQLRDENPWIRAKQLTNKAGKKYKVRVPKERSLKRSTQQKKIYN
ncbi:MAG: lytic transglycosylase domain-containing protein, partial [Muribaculaceae bacterium]|nr:lytic transglycosylase domain-containing protein [Muribaculaceae bacterium]